MSDWNVTRDMAAHSYTVLGPRSSVLGFLEWRVGPRTEAQDRGARAFEHVLGLGSRSSGCSEGVGGSEDRGPRTEDSTWLSAAAACRSSVLPSRVVVAAPYRSSVARCSWPVAVLRRMSMSCPWEEPGSRVWVAAACRA